MKSIPGTHESIFFNPNVKQLAATVYNTHPKYLIESLKPGSKAPAEEGEDVCENEKW